MLDAFLERIAATPFVDGQSDCALTIADWVILATGCPDPADHLRGQYDSPLQRERLLRRLGGLETVVEDCARRALLPETLGPRRGDIGVVRVGKQVLTAICLGERWAIKGEGVVVAAADHVYRAWRV